MATPAHFLVIYFYTGWVRSCCFYHVCLVSERARCQAVQYTPEYRTNNRPINHYPCAARNIRRHDIIARKEMHSTSGILYRWASYPWHRLGAVDHDWDEHERSDTAYIDDTRQPWISMTNFQCPAPGYHCHE
jgi:hypothetical protein